MFPMCIWKSLYHNVTFPPLLKRQVSYFIIRVLRYDVCFKFNHLKVKNIQTHVKKQIYAHTKTCKYYLKSAQLHSWLPDLHIMSELWVSQRRSAVFVWMRQRHCAPTCGLVCVRDISVVGRTFSFSQRRPGIFHHPFPCFRDQERVMSSPWISNTMSDFLHVTIM